MGNARHTHLGITHGCGRITINGTEVTLAIDQHVTHGEWLRHPYNGVIDSGITVWVVFTDNVTNHTGRLLVGLIPVVAQLAHGVEHATVDRFEAITHIWQRSTNDYTHGVIEIGLFHLLLDIYREDFFSKFRHSVVLSFSRITLF